MKKIFMLMALCASIALTSCTWIHETFYSTEDCCEWYLDELYEAAVDRDAKKFRDRANDLSKWEDGLSASELDENYNAGLRYGMANPNKVNTIFMYAYELGVNLE